MVFVNVLDIGLALLVMLKVIFYYFNLFGFFFFFLLLGTFFKMSKIGTVPVTVIVGNNKSDIVIVPAVPGEINFAVVFKTILELDSGNSIH